MWQALLLTPETRGSFPRISVLVGLLAAGAAALTITRGFDLDLPAWAVALAAYAFGGAVAAATFTYAQLFYRRI